MFSVPTALTAVPMPQRVLHFDVVTMYLGLGPWRLAVPLKKEVPLQEMDKKWVHSCRPRERVT